MTDKKEGIRLSYSAHSTYQLCSEKFRLERILKIVPETIATPLFFGSACDQASDVIFKAKMKSKATGKFDTKFNRDEMIARFKDAMTVIDYQGEKINITKSTKVKYSKADVQPELLEESDRELINKFLAEKELEVDSIEDYIEYFKEKKERDPEETEIYNYMAWFCLYRKGIMMLDRLVQWADENILEVISVQNYFKLENEDNDVFSGLSDLEAILVSDPNTIYTLDLKTATGAKKSYPDGCIETAEQLHIYSEATGNEKVGYIVLEKAIKVRAPRVQLREVYGTVTQEQRDRVFETIDETLQNVRAGKFEKNPNACFNFGKCTYYSLCHYGKMEGLVPRIYASKKEVDKQIEPSVN